MLKNTWIGYRKILGWTVQYDSFGSIVSIHHFSESVANDRLRKGAMRATFELSFTAENDLACFASHPHVPEKQSFELDLKK